MSSQLKSSLHHILSLSRSYQDFSVSADRILTLESTGHEDPDNAIEMPTAPTTISLNNVSFSYPESTVYQLTDVSFTLERGGVFGLVGPSGCGKSSVIKLLSKLYETSSGEILIDGYLNVSEIKSDSWRSYVGVVQQESFIFSDTILGNILLGQPLDNERLDKAIFASRLDQLLLEPKVMTLDYHVGVKGSNLSGGQRQRVILARALYRNPGTLLLDEAMSALDPENEAEILLRIANSYPDLALLVVTHRPYILPLDAELLIMEKGQIAQRGRRSYLEESQGVYKRVFAH